MKEKSPQKSIHRDSKNISLHNKIPFLNTPFASALNYINKDNNHPLVGDKMYVKDIVFSKEELTNNKWLIQFPKPLNPKFIAEVTKILNHWHKINVQVVMQSEASIKEEENRIIREKKIQDKKHRDKFNNFKFKENILTLNPLFIVAKYKSLDDFKNNKNNWKNYSNNKPENCKSLGNFECAENIITKQYKLGDEIWHYSEYTIDTIDIIAGGQKELFLLIRGNKLICSPLINSSLKCF